MDRSAQIARATEFQRLNQEGGLLLPNVWDAVSARIFDKAGFPAIGTTSAGIAYTRGLRDGEQIERDDMMREIASIVRAVDCPVTADVEAGYGHDAADVTRTVDEALAAGAVGVNLEDNRHGEGDPLFTIVEQTARLGSARASAERRGIPLVINARTDTFLLQLGSSLDDRIDQTIERGRAYLRAGADLVFVPLAIEPAVVRRLADGIGPISVMAVPGAPTAKVLFHAGAKRVSLGQIAMLATLGLLREIAQELRESGRWTAIERSFYGFGDAEALFSRA